MKLKKKLGNKIKAILWDMDGVLIDSENLHSTVESETAKHFGINISPDEIKKKYSGMLLKSEFEEIFKDNNQVVPYEKMREVRDKLLLEYLNTGIKTINHANEVLKVLSVNFKMALVSSTERFWAEKVLEKLGLREYLDILIFGEDTQKHKPDPEPYLKAAEMLNVEPSQAIVIEDYKSGFNAAKNAGMLLIARKANHNSHLDFSQADFVVEDLNEIPSILEKINHG